MRRIFLLPLLPAAAFLVGCGSGTTSYVKSDTTLGRVVVYRNGVAYFERTATVENETLKLAVPGDKVDDFLKSLTVVDAKTGQPAPVSYPSQRYDGATTIDMKIALAGSGPHSVRLSYVTEAPSWKPSYRVTLGKAGKVDLQSWAVVDNTSGEDWQNVKLGVGSSSAMSFRFDLLSLRNVQRQTLQAEDLFAMAPPTGGVAYGGQQRGTGKVLDLNDEAIALNDDRSGADGTKKTAGNVIVADSTVARPSGGRAHHLEPAHATAQPAKPMPTSRNAPAPGVHPQASPPPPPREAEAQQAQFAATANALRGGSNQVVVEGFATPADGDKFASSLERANRVREQLIRSGLDGNRIVAVGKGEQPGRTGGVRIVEAQAPQPDKQKEKDQKVASTGAAGAAADPAKEPSEPIGTSHFESGIPMTVPKGTSAMVSILKTETEGDVVYLFDAESPRGNATYPFKAVRLRNPTESALEQGPVTVFGEGRFIGEGMAEPIPARSIAFVPFALDRQIVVEKKDTDRDEIARVITVQRGVFSTEVKHTKKRAFTLHNRLGEKAVVYLRHTVSPGYKLGKAPASNEKIGGAHLFRVDLDALSKMDVEIEESTPTFKTTDIRSPAGLDMIKAYLSSAAVEGPLKDKVTELLKIHAEMANVEQQIATLREQMSEYRARMDELHAQIVTLRAVKTAGPIMAHLEKKLQEVSDKVSKSTVELVGLQEKLMVARVRFQDGVADLSLDKKEEPKKDDEKKDPKKAK
jgi:flagellar biosynthesis chaperone FliJ